MQLPLVNYQTAKMLKEAGFDWKCREMYFYDLDNPTEQDNPNNWVEDIGELMNWNGYNTTGEIYISRPTVAQALMYLREVKGVHVEIRITGMGKYWGEAKSINTSATTESFPTHSEAEHAALIKALETLKSK